MASERKLTVVLAGDAKSLKRAIGQAETSTSNLGSKFDTLGGKVGGLGSKIGSFAKVAAVGLGAAAVGLVALGTSFVNAGIESQKIGKQTEAVLKSMGDQAGVTADDVADLSDKLSRQSGIDDELIQSGQNVLLTFGKVQNKVGKGNKVFDRATEAALDMSVALGTDMQGATIQIGKALNDPIKGITALSRAGVSFSQEQKDQIKAMVAYGDTLGAQKVILGELEAQFGGSAAAQATAGDRLRVAWGNLQEQLGEKLIPIFETVASWMADTLPGAFDTVTRLAGPVVGTLQSLARDGLQALSIWWDNNGDNIVGFFRDLGEKLGAISQPIAAWIWETALPKLKEGGQWLIDNDAALFTVLTGITLGFAGWAVSAAAAAASTWLALAPLIPFIAIGAAAAGIYYLLADRGDGFTDVLARTYGALLVVGGQIIGFFKLLWEWGNKAYDAAIRALAAVEALKQQVPGASGGSGIPLFGGPLGTLEDIWSGLTGDDGGVVPGPRGAPRMVLAHGGETMIPTHKTTLPVMHRREPQVIQLVVSGKVLAEVVAEQNALEGRNLGIA